MVMEHTIQEVIAKLFNIETTVQLTRPDPKFGDFATNVALQLAKPLGKNPRESGWTRLYQRDVKRPSGAGVVKSAAGHQSFRPNGRY